MNWLQKAVNRAALAAALALSTGCGDDGPDRLAGPPEGTVPDFTLTDVNPNSPTGGRQVSPRDHLGRVSAWYFGSAT